MAMACHFRLHGRMDRCKSSSMELKGQTGGSRAGLHWLINRGLFLHIRASYHMWIVCERERCSLKGVYKIVC